MTDSVPAYTEKQLNQAVTWFVRLQSDGCSERDRLLFQHWLAKHSAHEHAFAQAEQIWGKLDTLKPLSNNPMFSKARSAKLKNTTLPAQLFVLLVSFLGGAAYIENTSETITYMTVRGERRHLVLADETQIDLNTNTQITVKLSLLHRQLQLLQGEALFNVKHEAWRDFTVEANTLRIRDIGTRFNVQRQADNVTVTVLEGEIELEDAQSTPQRLFAGHQQIYNKNNGLYQQQAVSTDVVTAWLDGHLIFKKTPLNQVVTELERYHHVQFVFARSELAQETVSGTFNAADLEPFLHSLKSILSIQAKRQGNTIWLSQMKKK